jgi:hypothetical protein
VRDLLGHRRRQHLHPAATHPTPASVKNPHTDGRQHTGRHSPPTVTTTNAPTPNEPRGRPR